ncbi:hypothetical protein RHGRI_014184 [Rhododendron griersonianum]|uniref:Uncharacterized protein n=1 Tax=Rhododendron griersonianum TaxID=479676 RepID=A0AAV6K8E2_9ERIC|nr:hypothetical protein RHGRI_014184 [Rhododendron griersonianum]
MTSLSSKSHQRLLFVFQIPLNDEFDWEAAVRGIDVTCQSANPPIQTQLQQTLITFHLVQRPIGGPNRSGNQSG